MTRPARLEALEGRAMLATGIGLTEALRAGVSAPPEVSGQLALPASGTTTTLVPGESSSVEHAGSWRVAMHFPWRVASHVSGGGSFAGDRPEIPHPDPIVGLDPESVRVLAPVRRLQLEGVVLSGGDGHVFGLSIPRGMRALQLSYELRPHDPEQEPDQAGPVAVRIWLGDAEGNLIDSWWLDPSAERLDVRLLALTPARSTRLYLGIEAVGVASEPSSPVTYWLDLQRPESTPTILLPPPGDSPVETPIGTEMTDWGGLGPGGPARWAGVGRPGFEPGIFGGPAPAGPGGMTRAAEILGASMPARFGGGLVRPLPIQGASTVGGLLAAGPAVRGERGAPEQVFRIDEFADPLLMASDPIGAEGAAQPDRDPSGGLADGLASRPEPALPAERHRLEIDPDLESSGISRLVGPGALPLVVAGLRTARGRPSALSAEDLLPTVPEELAALVADPVADPVPVPVSPRRGAEGGPSSSKDDPELDPTSPRVLRTALIGVAALAVGLLLPDLASDRSVLRQSRRLPALPKWTPRPWG